MKFSVIVHSAPDKPASEAALKFCIATHQQSHSIHRIFFLDEGVLNSHLNQVICKQWITMIESSHCDAACCTASAQRYGLSDKLGKQNPNMSSAFKIAGIGQLVEASLSSDRIITFGQR